MAALRSTSFLLVAGVVVLLLVLAGGVFAYDRAREDTIAEGVTIGGVDVGGLTAAKARDRVRAELAEPLQRDLVAKHGDVELTLTTRTSQVAVDVDRSVEDALARSRDGSIVGRTVRGITGGEVDAALDPEVTYDEAGVDRLVARAQKRLDRTARDARVDFTDGALTVATSREGREVKAGALRTALTDALAQPAAETTIPIEFRRTKPKVGTKELADEYPTMLAVDRSKFQLTLYKGLEVEKRYTVAIGQIGLDTPAGEYEIQNKAVDPTWSVPNSAWAGDLAGSVIPPGPSNPLKARWMGIYGGAGIHGTDATYSLGTAASHGCVRMAIPDVIELYDRVPVGTPIYIA